MTHNAIPVERRRGIALMLVMLVMGAAVIMAAAFLSFEPTATVSADRALEDVQSHWAAEGAANQAVALFESGVSASTNAGDMMTAATRGAATSTSRSPTCRAIHPPTTTATSSSLPPRTSTA